MQQCQQMAASKTPDDTAARAAYVDRNRASWSSRECAHDTDAAHLCFLYRVSAIAQPSHVPFAHRSQYSVLAQNAVTASVRDCCGRSKAHLCAAEQTTSKRLPLSARWLSKGKGWQGGGPTVVRTMTGASTPGASQRAARQRSQHEDEGAREYYAT
ncbi:unnamed protein product [Cercospora beticola]|nr:unnamed protein product [Cercospora beticola]